MQPTIRKYTRHALLAAAFAVLIAPAVSVAGPSTRPSHPVRPPRPDRPPRFTQTVVRTPAATPTPQPGYAACPVPAKNILDTRLWHLFWKYPGVTTDLTGRAAIRVARDSNGLHPESEPASLALVSSTGESIIAMPELHFTRTGDGSWAASTDQGYVVLQTMPGAYTVSFNFQSVASLTLPPDFYSTGGKLCFTIGDEGVFERFVCQEKPGGGFLCHE